MKDPQIGQRVELVEDTQYHKKGERGVIGEKGGHIGIVFDNALGKLTIATRGYPIFNFVKFVEDERLVQKSLFGDSE